MEITTRHWNYVFERPVHNLNRYLWGDGSTRARRVAFAVLMPLMYLACYAMALVGRIFFIRTREYRMGHRPIQDVHSTLLEGGKTLSDYTDEIATMFNPGLRRLREKECEQYKCVVLIKLQQDGQTDRTRSNRVEMRSFEDLSLERFKDLLSLKGPVVSLESGGKIEYQVAIVGQKQGRYYGFAACGNDPDISDGTKGGVFKMSHSLQEASTGEEAYRRSVELFGGHVSERWLKEFRNPDVAQIA